ncbi:hypothetical protein DXT76_12950, partial [Halobacillus trueperi]
NTANEPGYLETESSTKGSLCLIDRKGEISIKNGELVQSSTFILLHLTMLNRVDCIEYSEVNIKEEKSDEKR